MSVDTENAIALQTVRMIRVPLPKQLVTPLAMNMDLNRLTGLPLLTVCTTHSIGTTILEILTKLIPKLEDLSRLETEINLSLPTMNGPSLPIWPVRRVLFACDTTCPRKTMTLTLFTTLKTLNVTTSLESVVALISQTADRVSDMTKQRTARTSQLTLIVLMETLTVTLRLLTTWQGQHSATTVLLQTRSRSTTDHMSTFSTRIQLRKRDSDLD
mmetsp:Transcript_21494/g.52667  ORF Transcript_21494/g.52667 Transcript_21494/m.52667 type:complete len:214 (-) Transcript_21494:959-1600(-)